MITYHQMTLADVFTETQEIFESDKPEFLRLLESTIDLCEIVPVSFRNSGERSSPLSRSAPGNRGMGVNL